MNAETDQQPQRLARPVFDEVYTAGLQGRRANRDLRRSRVARFCHRDARAHAAAAILARIRGPAIAALTTALALAPTTSACGAANKPITAPTPTQSRVLVSFSEEGGLQYRFASLVVSTHRQATVTSKGRTVRFQLGRARWRKLNAILKQTDLSTVAGDYPPRPGAADEVTYVISVGGDTVRATDASELPERVSHEVEPLRQVSGEIVAVGRRRLEKRHGAASRRQAG